MVDYVQDRLFIDKHGYDSRTSQAIENTGSMLNWITASARLFPIFTMKLTSKKPKQESEDPLVFRDDIQCYQSAKRTGRLVVHVQKVECPSRIY